jgi:hypothetical protein
MAKKKVIEIEYRDASGAKVRRRLTCARARAVVRLAAGRDPKGVVCMKDITREWGSPLERCDHAEVVLRQLVKYGFGPCMWRGRKPYTDWKRARKRRK